MKLTAKQEAFALAYVKCLNAPDAYRVAYPANRMNANAINVESARLLKNPKITLRIGELVKPAVEAASIEVSDILRRIALVARFDIRKLNHPDGTPKAISELDDDTALAVSHRGPHGLVPHDRLKALDMAMKYLGLYEKDNRQQHPGIDIEVTLVRAGGQ